MSYADLPRFAFGDGPEMADELLALVLAGDKRATCWADAQPQFFLPQGSRYVIRDGQGRDRVVLESVELTQRRFDEVDEAFAFDEGEDDKTLESWRQGHQEYFTRHGIFAPDMLVWCERFKIVEVLTP